MLASIHSPEALAIIANAQQHLTIITQRIKEIRAYLDEQEAWADNERDKCVEELAKHYNITSGGRYAGKIIHSSAKRPTIITIFSVKAEECSDDQFTVNVLYRTRSQLRSSLLSPIRRMPLDYFLANFSQVKS